jgi:pimeloyl-ACP methyl ester carboxylesterase
VLLLHGLAGTALEWQDTAAWLTENNRVVAPDQRGHGRSERRPPSVSTDELVADVLAIVDEAGFRPVTLIGQSFGGLTAFLVAARHPDRVRALVVAEASPAPAGADVVEKLDAWLRSWPVPFESREEGRHFFGGDTLSARAWTSGLEERGDGWWPSFDPEVVTRTLAETIGQDYWREWESIEVPTLIVRGERGWLDKAADEMAARVPGAKLATLTGAGHDVHLEAPQEWRHEIEEFLRSISTE